jgi:hypothetical protein
LPIPGGVKLRLNRCHYSLSYLVLKRKDAGEFPVIAFGPNMMPSDGINELRADTQLVRRLANTTFKRVASVFTVRLQGGVTH